MRIICLRSRYPKPVRFRGTGAGRSGVSYLALHPMGFSVPRRLRFARCALTAPFHHHRQFAPAAVYFLWHFPSRGLSPARVYRPRGLSREVTRHRALWCSDFPLPARAGSDSPPFQNRRHHNALILKNQGERGRYAGCINFE